MLQINRYVASHFLFSNFFSSKLNMFTYTPAPRLQTLRFRAGLYRLSSARPEHGLLLSSLSGSTVQTHLQFHGKRQRKTLSINADVTKNKMWAAFDKLMHGLIPLIQDLMTPKSKKTLATNMFTLRIRQKFSTVDEFEDILENQMYESHKGIYLPLTVHLNLDRVVHPSFLEAYLRMLRLPVSLSRRKPRPAYDDKVEFIGMAELYHDVKLLSRHNAPRKKK